MVRDMMRRGLPALVAIISLVVADLHAQGSKNILRIRIDTVTISAVTPTVTLNIWYSIDGSKPHSFRGFQCDFAYEKYQIEAASAFSIGTASRTASLFDFIKDYPYAGQARLLVRSDAELDITKPVLFRLIFNTKGTLYDTLIKDFKGLMEIFFFEVLGDGIDEVFIENDSLGWIQYQPPVMPDPEPPKKRNIAVSTDSVTVMSDSTVQVPLNVTTLDSAMVKYGAFGFTYDTSILAFIGAEPGDLLGNGGTLDIKHEANRATITFFAGDTSKALAGTGELFVMRFRAIKREDTVCTEFRDSGFFVLNEGALTDTISYALGNICVFGIKEDMGVVSEPRQVQFRILPNPAHDEITILTSETRSCDLMIWNVLGKLMMQTAITGDTTIDMRSFKPGTYRVVLMRSGSIAASQQFIIMR
jgi:hypothetical protein